VDADTTETADVIYRRRPGWGIGTIALADARYLFERVVKAGASTVAELGSA